MMRIQCEDFHFKNGNLHITSTDGNTYVAENAEIALINFITKSDPVVMQTIIKEKKRS